MFTLPFLCASSSSPSSSSQPTATKESGGGSAQGWVWERRPGFSPESMAVASPAKLCAFLLQLSEEQTKGETQLCSNILIIYCSVAHVTGHRHLERSSGLEEELSFPLWRTVLFDLIFPSSSHAIPHGFRYVGQEERGGGETWQTLLFVRIWAFKTWSSLLKVIILFDKFYLCYLNIVGYIWAPWDFSCGVCFCWTTSFTSSISAGSA